jgi:hypothetical protein
MKIHEYNEMMAHLTRRRPMSNGGRVNVQFGGGVEGQLKGTAAAKKTFMERQPNRIRPTFYDGELNIKGPKNQIKSYLEDLKKRFEFPITSQEYLKGIKDGTILSNEALAKKYKVTLGDVERINRVLKRDNKLEYKKQTLEGEKKIQRERDVRRKADIRKISSPAMEQKIKREIKKVDPKALAKEVDVAHRASLKANSAIGADYLTTSLGIDKKIVNQELVKPTEQKLGTLYKNQQKLIKNLKPGKVPKETQKEIEKINKKISELSDRTKGALQGVLIDEKTLKPFIYGVDYKKVLGAGLVDKPVKDLTKADLDLIKLQIPEQIKAAKSSGTTLGSTMIQPELANLDTRAARNLFSSAGKIALGELGFAGPSVVLDTYAGLTPSEMALNVATFGFGTPLKDSVQKRKYIADAGFGSDYSSALTKRRNLRTAPEDAVGQLTDREKQAIFLANAFDAGLDLQRAERAADYQQRQQSQLKRGELEIPDYTDVPEATTSIQPEFQEETEETRSLPFGLDRLLPFDDDEII